MAKGNRNKKKEIELTPEEKFNQLLTLKNATKCILGIEDKYKIYVRLTKEFDEFGKSEAAKKVEGADQCKQLSEECKKMAAELESKRPKETEDSQTVTTTVRKKELEKNNGKKNGKTRYVIFGVLLFAILCMAAYKIPAGRYLIANAEKSIGLNEWAMKSFSYTGDYKDSQEKLKETTYAYASDMMKKEKYHQARRKFSNLADKDYKDSSTKELAAEKELLAKTKKGRSVIFGNQKWLVLEKTESAVCLTKFTAINDVVYNDEAKKVTWETCSLRDYLNDRFLNSVFTKDEQEAIAVTAVENLDNQTYKTDGGVDTNDKIFILNENEYEKYKDVLKAKVKTLRLRTPGKDLLSTTYVSCLNECIDYGFPVEKNGACIRPTLWVMYK